MGSVGWVGVAVCIRSIVIRPNFSLAMAIGDFVLVSIVMNVATEIVPCFFPPSEGVLLDDIKVMLDSVPLSNLTTGAECQVLS